MKAAASQYPWAEELEKTVVNSLATSFGLDFLLFKDKAGGDVNTIHNVRQGVWATEEEKQRYDNRGAYNSDDYHHKDVNKQDSAYKMQGDNDKKAKKEGKLYDHSRCVIMGANEPSDVDHNISGKETHDDAGRVLAELNGVELANQSSNLNSIHATINRSKGKDSVEDFLARLPGQIAKDETRLLNCRNRLASMPRDTPEQQHKARQLEDEIRKTEEKLKTLKSVNPDEMRRIDKESRDEYNRQINWEYYTSSKFLSRTAGAAAVAGAKMGTRQMLGLIMAEVWFELREKLPNLLDKLKINFSLDAFVASVKETLGGIWQRVKLRFNDFLMSFKDGAFAGVMSSATTTLFNVFATTQKMAIKVIRELWGSLVKVIKLLVLNPDKLSMVDLCKAVTGVLSVGAATVVGTMVYAQLVPLYSLPFGHELASFVSALVTGVITLGLNYFLLYSKFATKIWEFIESLMPHAGTVRKFQEINAELDRYLTELGRIEFNLDADELTEFSRELASCNDEMQRGLLLKDEVTKRDIDLPFEMGNKASIIKFLASKAK